MLEDLVVAAEAHREDEVALAAVEEHPVAEVVALEEREEVAVAVDLVVDVAADSPVAEEAASVETAVAEAADSDEVAGVAVTRPPFVTTTAPSTRLSITVIAPILLYYVNLFYLLSLLCIADF